MYLLILHIIHRNYDKSPVLYKNIKFQTIGYPRKFDIHIGMIPTKTKFLTQHSMALFMATHGLFDECIVTNFN